MLDPPGIDANFLKLILSNFVMHAVDSIQHGFAYNPGLLSAWVVFVPFCYFAYVTLLKSGRLTTARVVQSILAGFGGHAILLALLISAAKALVSEGLMQVATNALTLLVRRPL